MFCEPNIANPDNAVWMVDIAVSSPEIPVCNAETKPLSVDVDEFKLDTVFGSVVFPIIILSGELAVIVLLIVFDIIYN